MLQHTNVRHTAALAKMRKSGAPNDPWPRAKRWCTTALGFAKICSVHVVIYTTGRAGLRLQRAEEGELCSGCHRIKIYCNVGDGGETAVWCRSNLIRALKMYWYTEEGQWRTFYSYHVQIQTVQVNQLKLYFFFFIFFKRKKKKTINLSGGVCQQVVVYHKSSYTHLSFAAGDSSGARFHLR